MSSQKIVPHKHNPIVQERWYGTLLGARQEHTYWMYKVIDDIITANTQLERFVEIGTGDGAASIIFGLHAIQAGTHLLTYDIRPGRHKPLLPSFSQLNIETGLDHWKATKRIQDHMAGKPTFFFCDGGDKKREFNFYAAHLASGSVIAAHDYSVEILPEHIQETVARLHLEPLQEEDWTGGKDDIQTCLYLKP